MSQPTIYDIPGGYKFLWAPERVQILVKRLSDDRKGLTTSAEIDIASVDPQVGGPLHQARLNLTSTTGRTDVVRALNRRDDGTPWADIIDQLCAETLKLHRAGEPIHFVGGDLPLQQTPRYRLWPMCPEGFASILFGEGGTGKSMLAILASILVQSGRSAMGLKPLKGNVLYLDYETSWEVMHERVLAICRGMQMDAPQIAHRYCFQPLSEDVETLEEIILDNDIAFMVVDSLGLACGGDPNEAEVAIRMMKALRELKRSSLLIDHMSKGENGGKPTPFGSVYKPYLARSVWHIKPTERVEPNHTHVGVYHKKVNFGPLRPPMGFDMRFQNDENEQLVCLQMKSFAVDTDPMLSKELPLRLQAVGHLREAKKLTLAELADRMEFEDEKSKDVLRSCLNHYKKDFVKIGDQWALASHETPP